VVIVRGGAVLCHDRFFEFFLFFGRFNHGQLS
jgi:hypothetical protein